MKSTDEKLAYHSDQEFTKEICQALEKKLECSLEFVDNIKKVPETPVLLEAVGIKLLKGSQSLIDDNGFKSDHDEEVPRKKRRKEFSESDDDSSPDEESKIAEAVVPVDFVKPFK